MRSVSYPHGMSSLMMERDMVDFHYETARYMLQLGEVRYEEDAHRRELNLDLGQQGAHGTYTG